MSNTDKPIPRRREFIIEHEGLGKRVTGVISFFVDDGILIFRNMDHEPEIAIKKWDLVYPEQGGSDGPENEKSNGEDT